MHGRAPLPRAPSGRAARRELPPRGDLPIGPLTDGPALRIDAAELYLVPLELREPFETAHGTLRARPVLLVELRSGGVSGWGECVALPSPGYARETIDTAWSALVGRILPAAIGNALPEDADDFGPAFGGDPGSPMALAAVEMAAWDLAARIRGLPLCVALGGSVRPVEAGVAIGLQRSDDDLFRRVEAHLEEGYRRIKIKIEPRRDIRPLAGIRDRFGSIPLAADANAAYAPSDRSLLREIDDLALDFIEQPLAPQDLDALARLQEALRTAICLDESIGSEEDARRALDAGAGRMINLKPGRVGGYGVARKIHDLCRRRGIPAWCGGMLESGIGRAHNVALATLPGCTLPGDLTASRRWFERDLVTVPWELEAGTLIPSERPGIGVEIDLPRVESLAERRASIA